MHAIVERHCRRWGLEPRGDCVETQSSLVQRVHRAGDRAVLKCFKSESDEQTSGGILAWFAGAGSVRILRADRSAQLLEWIDGGPLSDLVRDDRDSEASTILADVAASLHADRGPPPEGLWPLEAWMSSLLERSGEGPRRHREAARLARQLLTTTERAQPLHGDLHHDNILHHSERGWLAIDPKGLLGDRHYDFANALFNPVSLPDQVRDVDRLRAQARLLAERASLDLDRLLSFCLCYASLSEIWHEEDGTDPSHSRLMGEIVAEARKG